MSGSGKALINIIYEGCLMQLQRPRNQNKQIFEGFFQAPKGKNQERKVRKFPKPELPFPKRRSEEQLGCFLPFPGPRPGFFPGKAGNRRRREEAEKDPA